jgi:glucose/arabinose dehydrogenase
MRTRKLFYIFLFFTIWLQGNTQPQIELQLLTSGLNAPVGIVNAGDSRLFILEQRGLVRIIDREGNLIDPPFLDISDIVSRSGFETGLLGLAFHPDYIENGYFYVNYTRQTDGNTIVSRFAVDSSNENIADSNSEFQLLTVEQPYANHNGGQLLFGPDGYLYIALGDGGSGGDPLNKGQDLTTMLGKILRIDVNVENDTKYGIPAGNPFVDDETALDEIWAYGLRNPWRNSFDRYTGDFWIADVGQSAREEINFQPAGSKGGENYGWRCYEGNLPYNMENCVGEDQMVAPVFEYNHHGSGCTGSVTGGYVYRGAKFNGMFGVYIFGDYCTGRLYTVTQNAEEFEGLQAGNLAATEITSFGEDQFGEIYLAMQNAGEIYKVVETGDCLPVARLTDEQVLYEIQPEGQVVLNAFYNPSLEYQWYKDDEPVMEETMHVLEVSSAGIYSVHVTNPENGCSNTSAPVEITLATSAPILKLLADVSIFPNPAHEMIRIEGLPALGKTLIFLFDVKGNMIHSASSFETSSYRIPTGTISPGLYTLKVSNGTEVMHEKIIVTGSR